MCMRFLSFLLSLFFITHTLAGAASLDLIPQAIVAESVDATSGTYFEQEEDFLLSSLEELALRRTYSSDFGSWQFFPHCCLVQGHDSKKHKDVALTSDSNGTSLCLTAHSNSSTYRFQFKTALQNISKGCYADCRSTLYRGMFKLALPDGTLRTYEKISHSQASLGPLCSKIDAAVKHKTFFRLVEERLPSHNKILYRYHKTGFLHSVELVDKKEKSYGKILFHYNQDTVQAIVCDKVVASYQFKDGLLIAVTRVQKPSVTYTYDKTRLIKKELPDGLSISCSYDQTGKVVTLSSSVSSTPLYRFQYEKDKTIVTDSNQRKTIFCYLERALTSRELYQATTCIQKESFVWSPPDESTVQTLRGYTLRDGGTKILRATRYEFVKTKDSRILHEDIYKLLSSSSKKVITLDAEGLPTGPDRARLSSSYSIEHPWHLRLQEDDQGNRTRYRYLASSDLVEEKVVEKKDTIIQRESFDYDDDTKMVVKAVREDFGSATRITQKIKRSHTLDKEYIEEWRYDAETKKDYLVRALQHHFDPVGRLTKRELYNTKGDKAKTEIVSYDDHGNCIRQVNALGEIALYSFDANDNCIQVEDHSGCITHFTYDLANRPITTKECYKDGSIVMTRNVFDPLGNQTAFIDRYGNQTNYTYDIFGHCTSIEYPKVLKKMVPGYPKELFHYDLLGNCISKCDPNGHTERVFYNAENKPLSIQYPDTTTEHFYYKQGRLSRKLNRNNTITTLHYDSHQKVTRSETHALTADKKAADRLSHTEFTYAKGHCVTEKGSDGTDLVRDYDHYGRLESETEHNSKKEYRYDALHRLIRIEHAIDDKESLTECIRYDVLDRMSARWIREPDGSRTNFTRYSYDAFGNVAITTHGIATEQIQYIEGRRPHLITNAYGGITRIDYQEQVNLLGQRHLQTITTDPKGVVTIVNYDAFERAVEETIKDPFGAILSSEKKSYTLLGDLSRVQKTLLPGKESASFYWSYGPMRRLTSAIEPERSTSNTFNSCGELATTNSNQGQGQGLLSYEYTPAGRVQKISKNKEKEKKEIASFVYDQAGNIITGAVETKSATTREYFLDGLVKTETIQDEWGSYTLSYSYDRLGRMTKILLPDHSSITYRYSGSKLHAIIRKSKKGEEEYRHEYTKYNEQGQPVEEKFFTNERRTRTYAPSGALSSLESKSLFENIVERDALGNPTKIQKNKKYVSYVYDFLNRLIEEQAKQKQSYAYDALDNPLTPKTATDHLSYNAHDQLIGYKKANHEVRYSWDIYGRRHFRKDENSIRRLFFIGNCEIGAVDKEGNIIELKVPERIIGQEAQGAIAIELKGRPYMPTCDLLGNIVSLTSPRSGHIVESYDYTAFGTERIWDEEGKERKASSLANPWRYRGLRTDPTTHFVCFGFRDYDPAAQRFLTRDPLGLVDGLNAYTYANNNPIAYTDLYGLKLIRGACICCDPCTYHTTGVCAHGGGVLFDDGESEDEQEVISSGLEEDTSPSWVWEAIDDGLEAWDQFSNATMIAGAAATPFAGAGVPVLGFGVKLKAGVRVLKVSMPVIRKVAVPVGAFFVRSYKYLGSTKKSFTKWFRGSKLFNGKPLTKSNLRIGQQKHKAYKAGLADFERTFKEYQLPSGKKIDFLDGINYKIYEFKPNNPRSIKLGKKQLEIYRKEIMADPKFSHVIFWETILETY